MRKFLYSLFEFCYLAVHFTRLFFENRYLLIKRNVLRLRLDLDRKKVKRLTELELTYGIDMVGIVPGEPHSRRTTRIYYINQPPL